MDEDTAATSEREQESHESETNEDEDTDDNSEVLRGGSVALVDHVGFLEIHGENEENDEDVNVEIESDDAELDDLGDEGIEIVSVSDEDYSEVEGNSSNEGDNNNDDDDDDDKDDKTKMTFDISLPNSHMYMGEGMEDLHGRTIHTEGDTIIMPLYFQPGVVLAPGQTLPLNLFHPHPIAMMKKVTFQLILKLNQ